MSATDSAETPVTDKVSLPTLTAMVVGSMIGSGVFLLPRRFGTETGVLGAVIAWTIAGAGMLMLAFVFQRLATRKPDLDAGIFAYAKAGFGDYVGFNSAFGFWASSCGALLYVKARRERGLRVFSPAEAVLFGVIVVGAIAGVISLATGAIEI